MSQLPEVTQPSWRGQDSHPRIRPLRTELAHPPCHWPQAHFPRMGTLGWTRMAPKKNPSPHNADLGLQRPLPQGPRCCGTKDTETTQTPGQAWRSCWQADEADTALRRVPSTDLSAPVHRGTQDSGRLRVQEAKGLGSASGQRHLLCRAQRINRKQPRSSPERKGRCLPHRDPRPGISTQDTSCEQSPAGRQTPAPGAQHQPSSN